MAPAASKSGRAGHAPATQADDAKYRAKYKELKGKVLDIEEDNTKLSVQILKSKKAIQRLRIERAVLYDRLQTTTVPTNPYALSSASHLSALASSSNPSPSSSAAAPSILAPPSYPLADPAASELFLKQLDAQKLAALQRNGSSTAQFGEQPFLGIAGEKREAHQHAALLAAGGPVERAAGAGTNGHLAAGAGMGMVAGSCSEQAAPAAAVPQAVPLHQAQAMQVDQP
ncbi:hypothetical protein JCM11641_000530 [Rhodosporidiobolus odoratus]